MIVISTALPQRGVLKAMTAQSVCNGFSIVKLPGVDSEKIFELVFDNEKQQSIIEEICGVMKLGVP